MIRGLAGKVIAITGGSAGIGAATAYQCARAGMKVVVSARRLDKLDEVAAKCRSLGGEALAVKADVTSDADMRALVDKSIAKFGRLDVMFANAGYGLYATVENTTDEMFHHIFDVNLYGTIRTIRAALPVMKQQGCGQIIICSSAASEVGVPLYGAYSATKAAQDSIASALRAELADTGLAVTSVHPIPTTTEFFDVLAKNAAGPEPVLHSPAPFSQTAQHVARRIVKAIRRPKPEVWPSVSMQFGAALATAFPCLPAMALRKHMRVIRKEMARQSGTERGE